MATPQLYFVIPLRSAATTEDWSAVQTCLSHTLRSVGNQVGGRFRCLVICHEPPEQITIPAFCELIRAPFKAPVIDLADVQSERTLFDMRTDKGRKILLGLSIAKEEANSFVMFLDADDLISNRLAGFVSSNSESNGWYIDFGYRWNCEMPNVIFPRRGFYRECGSSLIIKSNLAPFPDKVDYTKDLDDYFIRRYVVHAYVPDAMQSLGFPLQPLSFFGCIYTFNGQNFYANNFRRKDSKIKNAVRFIVKGKWISNEIRREFGFVYNLNIAK